MPGAGSRSFRPPPPSEAHTSRMSTTRDPKLNLDFCQLRPQSWAAWLVGSDRADPHRRGCEN
jgi:hypothetical protein